MITETFQALIFGVISAAFIITLGISVWRIVKEGIGARIVHEPVRHEAVILQFRPRTKGRLHVR